MWPTNMKIAEVRVARPTNKLKEIEYFYCEGIGLRKIGSFSGHSGYDGLMVGLPDASYHLEFTQHEDGSPCPALTKDNLLVFYLPDKTDVEVIAGRLNAMGYGPVPPENPYWEKSGITIEDPDGWRIVLMNTEGI
ncbi:VOC family protein [Planomicrobium sp. CPCC 101079]|uniref:VOC family protein n=1 Tax=Planomicrobium sp. CPCC 101079 TaxID=2599618 RepID=UPI0011B82A67|nr:VOC family protein [Planomicrobium sp. CPCC 101079]TWT13334.1 VOC family protein [Planomicrobium sp. CPCC 101079]